LPSPVKVRWAVATPDVYKYSMASKVCVRRSKSKTRAMDGCGNKCCVVGCTNIDGQCSSITMFYRFPSDDNPESSIQRSMWIEAIQDGRYVGQGHGDLENVIFVTDLDNSNNVV